MDRHANPSPARFGVSLLLLAVAAVGCAPPERTPPGGGGEPTAAPPTIGPAASGPPEAAVELSIAAPTPSPIDVAGAVASFWWHDPATAAALTLRPAQVTAMDAAATAYLEGWNPAIQERRDGPGRVAAALAGGDTRAAAAAADRYADAVAYVEAGHQRLKVAVFELLDDGQRAALLATHARLFREPWVIGRRLGPGGRPRVR